MPEPDGHNGGQLEQMPEPDDRILVQLLRLSSSASFDGQLHFMPLL